MTYTAAITTDNRVVYDLPQLVNPAVQGINVDPPPGIPAIQRMTDGSLVVFPLAQFGLTGDDAGTINSALLQSLATGAPVRLSPAIFATLSPIVIPGQGLVSTSLLGVCPVVGEAAGTSGAGIFGSVIQVQPGWSSAGLPNSAAVYLAQPPAGNKLYGSVLLNFWTDLRAAPVGCYGISLYGSVNHTVMSGLGLWGNASDATEDLIHIDKDTNGNFPDGLELNGIIGQQFGRYGVFFNANDTLMTGVHMQATQASTTDSGCFYLPRAGNVTMTDCRGDQGIYGIITDANPGGSPNTPGSTIILNNFKSENVLHSGVLMTNSNNTQTRLPVQMNGGSLDFSGRDGTSAAVTVAGWNMLTMDNVNITCGGQGNGLYPICGLATQALGGGIPQAILVDMGIWNPGTGGSFFNDAANVGGTAGCLFRYRIYGAIGPIVGGGSPTALVMRQSTPWP